MDYKRRVAQKMSNHVEEQFNPAPLHMTKQRKRKGLSSSRSQMSAKENAFDC